VATGGDCVVSPVTGTRKLLTSGTRLPERECGCEGARASAADEWDRAGSGRGEGSAGARELGRLGREGGGRKAQACGREREREFGPETAQPRGGFPFFFFYFFYLLFF
jgi:hypothetical protein